MKWQVSTEYPEGEYSAAKDEAIELVVGRVRDSSGCGLGWRDMQWTFDSEADAEKVEEDLEGSGLVPEGHTSHGMEFETLAEAELFDTFHRFLDLGYNIPDSIRMLKALDTTTEISPEFWEVLGR